MNTTPPDHDLDQRDWRRVAVMAAVVAVGALALDQVTKTAAAVMLASGPAHVWTLHLRLVANRGILLGMIGLPVWLITLITLGLAAMTGRAVRRWDNPSVIAYALATGGAFGNLIDRYLQRPSFPPNAVVDWLSFGGMTFNLADVFIVAALLVLVGHESLERAEFSGKRGVKAREG